MRPGKLGDLLSCQGLSGPSARLLLVWTVGRVSKVPCNMKRCGGIAINLVPSRLLLNEGLLLSQVQVSVVMAIKLTSHRHKRWRRTHIIRLNFSKTLLLCRLLAISDRLAFGIDMKAYFITWKYFKYLSKSTSFYLCFSLSKNKRKW